ncbi:hypothetical protein [Priestia megaterium]
MQGKAQTPREKRDPAGAEATRRLAPAARGKPSLLRKSTAV